MTDLVVRPVRGRRDHDAFIRIAWTIHRRTPQWVPPLLMDVKHRLDRKKNPYFEHADAELFIAWRGPRVVGRISASVDRLHNEIHHEKTGFFGWFECERDPEAAAALFDTAERWAKERGMERLRGPASFSLNDEAGLLVQGFEEPPVLMMPWNPPWYVELVESAGFTKCKDLLSFKLRVLSFGAERMSRIVKKIEEREKLVVRDFDMSRFDREIQNVKTIYNDAWVENWGFVPLTDKEIDAMAKSMRPILEPRLASFVEVDGQPVGFSLVLPNINEILARIDGRLFPFGLFRLLFGKSRVRSIRLMAMGIRKAWHHRGLDSVLYYRNFVASRDLEKEWSDIGWVLEDNTVMVNTIRRIGGEVYKTFRLYERPTR